MKFIVWLVLPLTIWSGLVAGDDVDLDLEHIDFRNFGVYYGSYGPHFRSKFVTSRQNLKRIVSHGEELWKYGDGSNRFYCLHSFSGAKGDFVYLFSYPGIGGKIPTLYHRTEEGWKLVTGKEFRDGYYEMREKLPAFEHDVLDILDESDNRKFYKIRNQPYGVESIAFMPYRNTVIDKILAGNDVIWIVDDDVECLEVCTFCKDGMPIFVQAFVMTGDGCEFRYFHKGNDDNKWVVRTEDEYFEELMLYEIEVNMILNNMLAKRNLVGKTGAICHNTPERAATPADPLQDDCLTSGVHNTTAELFSQDDPEPLVHQVPEENTDPEFSTGEFSAESLGGNTYSNTASLNINEDNSPQFYAAPGGPGFIPEESDDVPDTNEVDGMNEWRPKRAMNDDSVGRMNVPLDAHHSAHSGHHCGTSEAVTGSPEKSYGNYETFESIKSEPVESSAEDFLSSDTGGYYSISYKQEAEQPLFAQPFTGNTNEERPGSSQVPDSSTLEDAFVSSEGASQTPNGYDGTQTPGESSQTDELPTVIIEEPGDKEVEESGNEQPISNPIITYPDEELQEVIVETPGDLVWHGPFELKDAHNDHSIEAHSGGDLEHTDGSSTREPDDYLDIVSMDISTDSLENVELEEVISEEPIQLPNTVPCILDIEHPDLENIRVREDVDAGLKFRRFYPSRDVHITSVLENGLEIWNVKPGEKLRSCYEYSVNGHEPLIFLKVNTDDKVEHFYFTKNASGWEPATEQEFDSIFENFLAADKPLGTEADVQNSITSQCSLGAEIQKNEHSDIQEEMVKDVILDISNVDRNAVETRITPIENTMQYIYIPLPGHKIVQIVDGQRPIWSRTLENEHCVRASSYTRGNKAECIQLFCLLPTSDYFYADRDGKWEAVNHETYKKLLTAMKQVIKPKFRARVSDSAFVSGIKLLTLVFVVIATHTIASF